MQSSTLNTSTNSSTPIFFDNSEPYETNSKVFFLKIPLEDSMYTNTDSIKLLLRCVKDQLIDLNYQSG